MNHRIMLALACAMLASAPAGADEPATPAPGATHGAPAVPAYDVLYLADKADAKGPEAVVQTEATSEDDWKAIGRDLRAKRPGLPSLVVIFISQHAIPMPEGYPDCPPDQRQAFERWTLGTYVYQARGYQYNETGEVVETVKQHVAEHRERTLNGVDVIELQAPDPTTVRNEPAAQRIVGVSVVVPGLREEDLHNVARAYEDEFGTPRLLQIVFFGADPDWPDKPFMTQSFYNRATRIYLRSSRAKDEDRTEVLPLSPRWGTLKNGELVEK